MQTQSNVQNKYGRALVVAFLAVSLLGSCGGRSGAAIHAYSQTIAFAAAPTLLLHGTATVLAKASSGLAVSYSSSTPAICSVDSVSGLVTNIAYGDCIIAADQAGDTNYAPARQVKQTIVLAIDPNQIITLGAAPALTLFGHGVVSATVNSGLAPAYSSTTPNVCSVNSSTGEVSDLTTGNCIIAVDQAGDAYHFAAPQVTQTLMVAAWTGALRAPDTPGSVTASAGTSANTVTLSFLQSVSSGGSPITAYIVTSTPAGIAATGTASPTTVNCPATCTGYAFTVAASNAIGNSAPSATVHVLTNYNVTATFFEPDTQPNNSNFNGTFTFDSTSSTVSNLRGTLTESMTHIKDGIPMDTVPLSFQLSAIPSGTGGLLVTAFALNTTNTLSANPIFGGTNGWAPASGSGLYYGFPSATNPANGGTGNAYAMIYVNLADPTAALTAAQINQLSYADCTAKGMMGDVCMTGTSLAVHGTIGTMSGFPISQTITKR